MRLVRRVGSAVEEAFGKFWADGCPKLAAAVSFYALLALFPLAIMLVAVAGLVLGDETARTQVIDFLLDNVPLREDEGRAELETLLRDVTGSTGITGAVGLAGLLFASSGVMGALRYGLNTVWGVQDPRPPLPAKALEIGMVLLSGVIVGASLCLTFLVREVSRTTAAELGAVGRPIADVVLTLGQLLPALLAFVIFTALYAYLPAAHVRLRHALPGALLAAAGYEGTKTLFVLYLSNVASIGAVYASLGTVIAFLVFVWVTAQLFLFGAEITERIPQVSGEPGPGGEPFLRRVVGGLRGLAVREPEPDEGTRRELAQRDEP